MNRKTNRKMLRNLVGMIAATAAFAVLMLIFGIGSEQANADQLYPEVISSDGNDCEDVKDAFYMSTQTFEPGTEITITSEEPISSLYILWNQIPGEWTLRIQDIEYTYGKDGYIHEYLTLPQEAGAVREVTILTEEKPLEIADIYAFSKGPLPDFVQIWEPSYEEADILFLSTHADDEILFFGGIIPNYVDRGNVRIQLAYFNEYFSREEQSDPVRNHEILNGLWAMGLTHYPQFGEFFDAYMNTMEDAEMFYGHEESLEYVVRTIRRFKPQIVVGQDYINGEYGHGTHIWTAHLIAEAADITGDASQFPESAERFGTWDVSKIYFHLYPENPIVLNVRLPLEHFGGLTDLEVAEKAYGEHLSQHWTDFIVSDGYDDAGNPTGYQYSLARYGLYRSLVGEDTTGDILDHIVTYDEQQQAKAAEEAARIAAEEEAARIAEEERVEAEAKAVRVQKLELFTAILLLAVLWTITILILCTKQAKYRRRKRLFEYRIRRMQRKFDKIDPLELLE